MVFEDYDSVGREVELTLRGLGSTGKRKGFHYLVFVITEQLRQEDQNLLPMAKQLYQAAAARFRTTPAAIERGIRCQIAEYWTNGDRDLLGKLARFSLSRHPTNIEFIDIITSHLRRNCLPAADASAPAACAEE